MKTIIVPDPENDTDKAGIPNILELFDGIDFPASKISLIDYAIDQDASEEVLEQLRAMPERDYRSIHEVGRFANRIEPLPGAANQWSSEESHDLPRTDAKPRAGSLNRL